MSDERDGSDAAADDTQETAEVGGRTAVATRPQRPTGKRSRARAAGAAEAGGADADAADTEDDGDAEVSEPSEDEAADGDAKAKATKTKTKSKTKKAKSSKNAKKSKKPAGPNPFVFVYNYLKQVVAELRKVIWPNRKQMITYTSVVLSFLVFMVALIGGADYGFAKLVLLVFGE